MKQFQQKIQNVEAPENQTKNPTKVEMKILTTVADLENGLKGARVDSQAYLRKKLEGDFMLDPFKTVDVLLNERLKNLSKELGDEFLNQAQIILDKANFEDCMISNESRVCEVFGESFMPILRSIDMYTEDHLRSSISSMLETNNNAEKVSSFNKIKLNLESLGIGLDCKLKGVEMYFSNNPKAAEKLIKFFDYLCFIKINLNKNIASLKNDLRNV
jgi:hypothetical protein